MQWNNHSNLKGTHAFLSPSSASTWFGKPKEYIKDRYSAEQAKIIGTELHELAEMHIKHGIKMPKTKDTLNAYINDAIGFKMDPEVTLAYSKFVYGTADAISFKKNLLRIHDLKTGVKPAHMEQLVCYAALFCLEYNIKPIDIQFELRIYQNNDILVLNPTSEDILPVMEDIKAKSKWLEEIIEY